MDTNFDFNKTGKFDFGKVGKRMPNDTQVETLQAEIRKLNPKPGASMGETEGRNMQQITPDFIIDTNDDGTITFSLNRGNIPRIPMTSAACSTRRPASLTIARPMP